MPETPADRARRFLDRHHGGGPLLMPNPWDPGSARLLVSLGFEALATTSSGFAATLGRRDGGVTRDEALEHARVMAAAVPVPVSADLEDCFAADPDGVAETVRLAAGTGLAGCSVEDSPGGEGIHERGLAVDRVRGGGRGRALGAGAAGAHRARRELPAREPRPGRHHRAPAGVPGGGRRRAVRAGRRRRRGSRNARARGRPTGQRAPPARRSDGRGARRARRRRGSASAGRSRGAPTRRWSTPRPSCGTTAPTATRRASPTVSPPRAPRSCPAEPLHSHRRPGVLVPGFQHGTGTPGRLRIWPVARRDPPA